MNHPFIPALAGLGLFVLTPSVRAETLAQYLFTSSTVSVARAASTTGANVTAGAFANGAGVTVTSSTLGSPDPRSFYVGGNLVDQAISSASPDWLGFTVSATSGNVLNLQNLGFAYAFSYNSGTAPTEAATFDVRSSVDGFASSIAVLTAQVGAANEVTWSQANIPLSASAYQGLGSIEFRIFLNDGSNSSGTSYLRIDTVTLTGVSAAPVPEPSAFAALAGLGALGFAATRRRPAQP